MRSHIASRVSPKHPDTHWSTEPAWHHCLLGPWGVPARQGTPDKTKEIRERPQLQNNHQHQAEGQNEVRKQMRVDVSTERVSATRRSRNNMQGSAVSEAVDKPTWVLILIAQMERISK